MAEQKWYRLEDAGRVESPGLIFYEERIKENIRLLLGMIPDVSRLRPHVKTHKSADVTRLMLEAGIRKFKCATISEAEMLGDCAAPDVLLAYQPVGPNIQRMLELQEEFPDTQFSCLVDNSATATSLAAGAQRYGKTLAVYIDVNVGMNRSGIAPGKVMDLYAALSGFEFLAIRGLHAYDGHIHDSDYALRTELAQVIASTLLELKSQIESSYGTQAIIIAGGSPTFPIYSQVEAFECSPGTFVLWDQGYQDAFEEQAFLPAALVLSRVVSLPTDNLICTDLGHKAIASENTLDKRVRFLNAPDLKPVSHSEEHLVLDAGVGHRFRVGDVLYGLPYHVCPTVALYEYAWCVSSTRPPQIWPISSRKRKLTI